MATDYGRITAENIDRYGTAIDEYGPLLLAERYSDHTHFIYELLQNAEDALGWRASYERNFPKDVRFELRAGDLLFTHYGLPFVEEHVRGICNIGRGTKSRDLTAIGKHGIGFKSVYTYTHHPEVHSGDEHFVIDLFVRPRLEKPKAASPGETVFVLPFDHPEVSREKAHSEIAARLKKLGLKTLLFLRHIESISWKIDSSEGGHYLRDTRRVADGIDRVTLLGQGADGRESMENWLVFRKPVEHNNNGAGFIEIAFALDGRQGTSSIRVVRVPESPLVVFFPTERETYLGFLIQGPYRTTPSRDNIPKDDVWNQELVTITARFVVECLEQLRELGFLTVSAMEALVLDNTKYEPTSQGYLFRPIHDAILEALETKRLIPQHGSGHVAAKNARLARAEKLRTLVSANQLRQITGAQRDTEWVTGEITSNLTPALHSFLIDQLGIEELDSEDFVRSLTKDFLIQQSDAWIVQFYAFLLELPFLRTRPWFKLKEIIRLEDGSQVTFLQANGTPNAYLPGPTATGFPTVRRAICRNEQASRFLVALGLTEPDPVDDVIQNVLPRYQKECNELQVHYEEDMNRIVDAFQTDSTRRREQLVKRLRDSAWVKCINAATGESMLKFPVSAYLPTQRLQELFMGNPKIWFVDRTVSCLQGKQTQAVLEGSGVQEYLRRVPVDCTLSYDERLAIRRKAGLERETAWQLNDYGIEGLPDVIAGISTGNGESERTAFVLWESLHDTLRVNRESFFYGEYSWSYSRESKTQRFPAQFVRLLQSAAWLPGPDGQIKKPSHVAFAELPLQFREKASLVLVNLLRFKPDEVKQLAEKIGIPEEILDVIRESRLSAEELRQRLGLDHQSAELRQPGPPDSISHGEVEAAVDGILGPDRSQPTATEEAGHSIESGGLNGGKGGTTNRASTDRRTEYRTYVGVHQGEPRQDGAETHEQRLKVEDAAIELIRQQDGPKFSEIRRMPKNYEGYDLEAFNEKNEVARFIEVKAMQCAWSDRPVTLSEPQFRAAQSKQEKFWLYVVERVGQSDAKIYRIPNPACTVRYFTFDEGWSSGSKPVA
jgi:Domain of unknown function (DUF3883)